MSTAARSERWVALCAGAGVLACGSANDSRLDVQCRYNPGVVPDLIYKLTRGLNKAVQTECEIVYVMVEIRKLMDRREAERRKSVPEADRRKLRPKFPILKLFCHGSSHQHRMES